MDSRSARAPHSLLPDGRHGHAAHRDRPERDKDSASGGEPHNRGDLERLIGLYAPEAQLYEPPDRLRDSGIEQIRQTYTRRFASAPGAKIAVAQRMTEGNFVVDREVETGGSAQPEPALVISEIRDGKIVRVWTLR